MIGFTGRSGSRQVRSQQQSHRISTIPIVAIGPCAGGLDAVCDVRARLRPDSGMAFVVIQHLTRRDQAPSLACSPSRLLCRCLKSPIESQFSRITSTWFRPTRRLDESAARTAIRLTISWRLLLRHKARLPWGVVLSGTGANGARGLAAFFPAGIGLGCINTRMGPRGVVL